MWEEIHRREQREDEIRHIYEIFAEELGFYEFPHREQLHGKLWGFIGNIPDYEFENGNEVKTYELIRNYGKELLIKNKKLVDELKKIDPREEDELYQHLKGIFGDPAD